MCQHSWQHGLDCSTGGHARKTDALDAASVTAVAVHHPRLRLVRAEGHSVGLRLLSDRRDDLAEERTRIANRLHALLRDLVAGGAKRNLTAAHAAGLLRTVRPMTPADEHRKSLAQDLLADLRRLDRALRTNAAQIQAALSASKTTLTTLHGIGPVLAAKILGTPVRSVDSRPDITTPATAGPHRLKPPAVSNADTASPGPVTDNSTVRCTSWPCAKSAPLVRARSTTSRNSPR